MCGISPPSPPKRSDQHRHGHGRECEHEHYFGEGVNQRWRRCCIKIYTNLTAGVYRFFFLFFRLMWSMEYGVFAIRSGNRTGAGAGAGHGRTQEGTRYLFI